MERTIDAVTQRFSQNQEVSDRLAEEHALLPDMTPIECIDEILSDSGTDVSGVPIGIMIYKDEVIFSELRLS
ncbi:MAG: hypothetical protein K2K74_11875 [Lachnospiraceae bacterium]|nr:hypothetical protein [Lachnospiraceae bacterium]